MIYIRVRDNRYICVYNKLGFIIKNETYLSTKDVGGTKNHNGPFYKS